MSIDNEIERALERHETDVRPTPGAWQEVQSRIRRRHRSRIAATALGAALAITGALVVIPNIGSEPNDRFDALPDGWRPIRSDQGGFRVGFPPGWKASDDLGVTIGVPPDAFSSSEGKPLFTVTFSIVPEAYDRIPSSYRYAPDDGRMRGRRLNRYSDSSIEEAFSRRIIYRIEWPRLCPHASCRGDYTLVAVISGTDKALWDRYRPTGERIVRSAEPAPVSKSSVPPGVQAKIRANAIGLAASPDALWALLPSPGGSRPGSLAKIDPRTNRIVSRMEVGVAPAGLAATPDAVWVTHGRCGDSCPGVTSDDLLAGSVWKIDIRTNSVVTRIPMEDAGDIAIGEGAVWVAGSNISKLDPATGRVLAEIGFGGRGPAHIAVGGGFLWAVASGGPDAPAPSQSTTAVSIVDLDNLRVFDVVKIPAGLNNSDVSFGFGTAWITSIGQDSPTGLARIDPKKGMTVWRTVSLPEAGNTGLDMVTTGEGFAWAVNGRGQLWKVDPATNHRVGTSKETVPMTIGDIAPIYANDVVAAFGSAWVASGDGQIWRVSP